VPLHPPAHHPFNPLLALRVSSLPLPDADRRRLIDTLFRAVWVDRLHVSEPEVVRAVADRVGFPGHRLVEDASLPEAKDRLRRQTDDALAAGVFGVPTVVADGELFFGFDDFPWLERFLAGDDPLDHEALAEWTRGLSPSAVRRRP
jgi:2-hydroxychromene-2-carboxylate isomerase